MFHITVYILHERPTTITVITNTSDTIAIGRNIAQLRREIVP
jgi:hypothetical protein